MKAFIRAHALLLLAGLVLTAVPVYPQSPDSSQQYAPPPPGSGSMAVQNPPGTNSTGKTSGSGTTREITATQFSAVDVNRDGRVSLEEFVSSPVLGGSAAATSSSVPGTPRSAETAAKVDADVQGRNTPAAFKQLDKDQDGFLSSTEIAAFYQVELEP